MAFGRTVFIGNPAPNNGAGAADIAALESLAQANAASFSSLRKKLRCALGHDPIRNRIGEGFVMEEV